MSRRLALLAVAALGLAMLNPGIASAKNGFYTPGIYRSGPQDFRFSYRHNWGRNPYRPAWQRPSLWDGPIRGFSPAAPAFPPR